MALSGIAVLMTAIPDVKILAVHFFAILIYLRDGSSVYGSRGRKCEKIGSM